MPLTDQELCIERTRLIRQSVKTFVSIVAIGVGTYLAMAYLVSSFPAGRSHLGALQDITMSTSDGIAVCAALLALAATLTMASGGQRPVGDEFELLRADYREACAVALSIVVAMLSVCVLFMCLLPIQSSRSRGPVLGVVMLTIVSAALAARPPSRTARLLRFRLRADAYRIRATKAKLDLALAQLRPPGTLLPRSRIGDLVGYLAGGHLLAFASMILTMSLDGAQSHFAGWTAVLKLGSGSVAPEALLLAVIGRCWLIRHDSRNFEWVRHALLGMTQLLIGLELTLHTLGQLAPRVGATTLWSYLLFVLLLPLVALLIDRRAPQLGLLAGPHRTARRALQNAQDDLTRRLAAVQARLASAADELTANMT